MAKLVLMVDDDNEIGQIWAHALRQRQLAVVLVTSANQALSAREVNIFDLVIINAHTPQLDGIDLVQKLRAMGVVPILLFTPRSDEEFLLKAYAAGVDECVATPIGPRLFLAKIMAWLRRSWTVSVENMGMLQVGPVRLDGAQRMALTPAGTSVKLTNLEFRVLYLLMSHYGQVLDTDTVIERVWGFTDTDGSNLLKNVVYRLRKKIEPDPAHPRYIRQVAGAGYTFKTGTTSRLRPIVTPP